MIMQMVSGKNTTKNWKHGLLAHARTNKNKVNMNDCRNCAELEYGYKHRECVLHPELHENWWNFIHTTNKTDDQIEKDFEGLLPFGCWKSKID